VTIQRSVVRSSAPSTSLTQERAPLGPSTAIGGSVIVSESALPSGASTSAKQDTLLTELQLKANLTETQPVSAASLPVPGLSIPPHNYIALTYTGDNLTSVVYKTGGSGGTTVATLTLAYTGSVLDSVTKS
jgi:hypothetical protein